MKAKKFKDMTEQEIENVFGKENIFEDADLILEENIFDGEKSQNNVFTRQNDNDKQAIMQIIEQIEVPSAAADGEELDAHVEDVDVQDKQEQPDIIGPDFQTAEEASEQKQAEQKDSLEEARSAEQQNTEQQNIEQQKQEQQKQEQPKEEQQEEHKYGKFKNPEELLKAYGELEKEFTRRSQKLKELESAREEAFKSEEDWRAAVDKFFEETPSAKAFSKDIANEIIAHPELKKDKNCLSVALTRTLVSKFRTPEQLLSDGQFLNEYVLKSQAVKDAVVAEYLRGVREGEPPLVLGGGGKQFATSAKSPKTIEEAGFMFLKENK